MKIKSLEIENIKSFREPMLISIAHDLNVFVGPNAGGKSNLLDIITILLRGLLLRGYSVTEGSDTSGTFNNISETQLFNPLPHYLDKFVGKAGSSLLTAELIVSKEDIDNIRFLRENRGVLEAELLTYRNRAGSDLRMLEGWDLSLLSDGSIVKYSFLDGALQGMQSGSPEALFHAYLYHFELFWILARNMEGGHLRPPALFPSLGSDFYDSTIYQQSTEMKLDSLSVIHFFPPAGGGEFSRRGCAGWQRLVRPAAQQRPLSPAAAPVLTSVTV